MSFWKRERPQVRPRVQRADTPMLLDGASSMLNVIGRAIEDYRAGSEDAIEFAVRDAALLKEMIDEVHGRRQ